MRPLWVMLVSAALVAGCLSPAPHGPGPEDTPSPSSPAPTRTSEPGVQPLAAGMTDTLFLLEPPHMAGRLPGDGAGLRIPVESYSTVVAGGGDGVLWSMPRPDLASLSGNATIFVEVQGTVLQSPLTQGCFWQVLLRLDGADGISAATGACVAEDTLIQPGVRELRVAWSGLDVAGLEGDQVGLSLVANGEKAPGATIEVLAGTAEHPSRLSLRGLAVPLDTRTLL